MKLSVFNMQRTPGSPSAPSSKAPTALPDTADIDTRLRLEALERALTSAAVLGGVIYLLSLPSLITVQNWLSLALYGLIVAGLIILTFARRLAYRQRLTGFLGLLLVGGALLLAAGGLGGSGRLLLLLWPLLAVILIAAGRLSRLGLMSANLLTITIISLLGWLGVIPGAGETGQSWIFAWLGYGLCVIAGTFVLDRYLNGLRQGLDEREQAVLVFDRERQRLEFQLREGTQVLQHRLVQIRTAAEITRSIVKELDLDRLLPDVCELVKSRFDLYYVGIFLIEPGSDRAVLQAGSGEAGQAMLAEGHYLQVGGDSMVGQAALTRQARIALDVGKESRTTHLARFANPHLPDTRSEMALPLISQQTVLGALSIQSDREAAFDEDDIVALGGIADILASAIENARLFRQTQVNLEEISQLHSQYLRRSWMQIIASQGRQEHVYNASPESRQSPASPHTLQVPILLREQMIGSLTLESAQAFGEKERALIEAVINQAALALENARLMEEVRAQASQEEMINQIVARTQSSLNLETVMKTAVSEIGSIMHFSHVRLQLGESAGGDGANGHPPQDEDPYSRFAADGEDGSTPGQELKSDWDNERGESDESNGVHPTAN
ncbi:MAG: hypothetical protein B6D39_04210 [Anaerolineae bacterium UTCFX2]|nr:GAF domain-containing protein [Anaerolineae bacterium]OQY92774.1 MAG: hypothetical protein B6D39_04210 [Anaerolineae bacterium UTCFX2]